MTEIDQQIVPETVKTQPKAFLFDVDGVVTHPETKQVERDEIIDFMGRRLEQGDFVALVTGRALDWVATRVIPRIKDRVKNSPELLQRLYVSGEFGGSYTTWENGEETHHIDPNIALPPEIFERAKEAAETYSSSHFVDPDKKTMMSIEMVDGLTVDEFKAPQKELAKDLQEIVSSQDPAGKFEVHMDRIATNIRDKRANKHYAAEQVAKWIKEKGGNVDEFVTFGDSASDTEMSVQLQKMGLPTSLVFVGGKEHLEGKEFDFPVTFTNGHCDNGVVEFIDQFETKQG